MYKRHVEDETRQDEDGSIEELHLGVIDNGGDYEVDGDDEDDDGHEDGHLEDKIR